jgi:hypothetical protein
MAQDKDSQASGTTPEPTAAQQKVLDRIATQRERLHARRAAREQSVALSQQAAPGASMEESLALRAMAFAREHPVAVAALGGLGLAAGPSRLIRWAGVVLPMVVRMRRLVR